MCEDPIQNFFRFFRRGQNTGKLRLPVENSLALNCELLKDAFGVSCEVGKLSNGADQRQTREDRKVISGSCNKKVNWIMERSDNQAK